MRGRQLKVRPMPSIEMPKGSFHTIIAHLSRLHYRCMQVFANVLQVYYQFVCMTLGCFKPNISVFTH